MRLPILVLPFLFVGMSVTAGSAPQDLDELTAQARRAKSVDDRIAAFEAIADLQPVEGVPLKRITKALTAGLKDDHAKVRRSVVALLGPKQDPEICVQALVKATKTELGDWKKSGDTLTHFVASGEGPKLIKRYHRAVERGSADFEQIKDAYNEVVREHMAALATHADVLKVLANQLGNWPSPRSVSAVTAVLKECSEGELADSLGWSLSIALSLPMVDALLVLGDSKSIDAVSTSIHSWRVEAKAAQKELVKMRKAKVGKYEDWEKIKAGEKVTGLEDHVEALRQRVHNFTVASDITQPPGKWGSDSEWRSWRTQVRSELPSSPENKARPAER